MTHPDIDMAAATAAARAGNLGIGRIQVADMSDAPAA